MSFEMPLRLKSKTLQNFSVNEWGERKAKWSGERGEYQNVLNDEGIPQYGSKLYLQGKCSTS